MEELHTVFARYTRPPSLVEALSSSERAPLASIGAAQLDRLALSAELDVLKHLLPRLLDLWASYRAEPHRRAALAEKLSTSGWQFWPVAEVHAIESYLLVQWSAFLSPPATQGSEGIASSADELLSAMSIMLHDLGLFTDEWEADGSSRATRVLVEFVSRHATTLQQDGSIGGPWWRDPGRGQLSHWLRRPEVVARLEEALTHPPAPDAEDPSQPTRARDYLSWMHPH